MSRKMYTHEHRTALALLLVNYQRRDNAIKALIARKITQLLCEGGTLVGIATDVGVKHPTIHHAKAGNHCGVPLQLRFADAYWGGSFDAMVAEALGNAPSFGCTETAQAATEPQYPERDRAVASARALGSVSEEAIARVVGYEYPSTVDPSKLSAKQWLDKMFVADDDIRSVPCATRLVHDELSVVCGGRK